jgi:hypothetical protein
MNDKKILNLWFALLFIAIVFSTIFMFFGNIPMALAVMLSATGCGIAIVGSVLIFK